MALPAGDSEARLSKDCHGGLVKEPVADLVLVLAGERLQFHEEIEAAMQLRSAGQVLPQAVHYIVVILPNRAANLLLVREISGVVVLKSLGGHPSMHLFKDGRGRDCCRHVQHVPGEREEWLSASGSHPAFMLCPVDAP